MLVITAGKKCCYISKMTDFMMVNLSVDVGKKFPKNTKKKKVAIPFTVVSVVYFDQHLSAGHPTPGQNIAFCRFFPFLRRIV